MRAAQNHRWMCSKVGIRRDITGCLNIICAPHSMLVAICHKNVIVLKKCIVFSLIRQYTEHAVHLTGNVSNFIITIQTSPPSISITRLLSLKYLCVVWWFQSLFLKDCIMFFSLFYTYFNFLYWVQYISQLHYTPMHHCICCAISWKILLLPTPLNLSNEIGRAVV